MDQTYMEQEEMVGQAHAEDLGYTVQVGGIHNTLVRYCDIASIGVGLSKMQPTNEVVGKRSRNVKPHRFHR